MDLLKTSYKVTFLFLLITSCCQSNKVKDNDKIDLPCRHVNPNKS